MIRESWIATPSLLLISVIIPTKDTISARYIQCVESITRHCAKDHSRYELITARYGGTFAQNCNEGVAASVGDQILLLNDDTILTNDLLQAFRIAALGHEQDRIIGARLLYPDNLVQHAGVGFDTDGCPYNMWRYAPAEHPEVMKPRILPAVTFACALIPRKMWEELGGLDERFVNSFEDVDFCLRAREAGYTVAYDPHVTCTHLEGQTEGRNDGIEESWHYFQERWIADGSIYNALGFWPFSLERK